MQTDHAFADDGLPRHSAATPLADISLGDLHRHFEATDHKVAVDISMVVWFSPWLQCDVRAGDMVTGTIVLTIVNFGQLTAWLAGVEYADRVCGGRPPTVEIAPGDYDMDATRAWDCNEVSSVAAGDATGVVHRRYITSFATLEAAQAFATACQMVGE